MPTVARADITVHYDGRELPREARALGEATGVAQGDAHNKAFEEKVLEGQSHTGEKLQKQYESSGRESALSFDKAFSDLVKKDTDGLARDIAKIFHDEGGIETYRKSLGDVGQGFDGVGHTVDDLQAKLQKLRDNGQLDANLFRRLSTDLRTYGTQASLAEADSQRLGGALQKLGKDIDSGVISHLSDLAQAQFKLDDEIEKTHAEAIRLNEAFDSRRLEEYVTHFEEGGHRVGGFGDDIRALNKDLDALDLEYKRGASAVDSFGRELESIPNLLTESERGFGRQHTLLRNFSGDLAEVEKVVKPTERGLFGLFRTVEGGNGIFSTAGKRIKGFFGAFSQFDPFDNAGQLILLIIALLGPLSVLASAAAGGILILGTAAGAAVAGLLGFYGIIQNIARLSAGDLKKLPVQMRENASAFQQLIGTYNKTQFKPGALFTGLGQALGDAFLKTVGLDVALKSFTDGTLPKLKAGLAPLGTALGVVFKALTTDLGSKSFLSTFGQLIASVEQQLPKLQHIASDAFAIVGQLFLDATPAAKDFEDALGKDLDAFLKFLQSPEGHDAVTGFFKQTQTVLGEVGQVLGDVVKGISELASNPEELSQTVATLVALGEAVPGIVALGDELSILAPVLADLIKAFFDLAAGVGGVIGFIIGSLQNFALALQVDLNSALNIIGSFADASSKLFLDLGAIIRDIFNPAKVVDDINQLAADVQTGLSGIGDSLAAVAGNYSSLFDTLTTEQKTALNDLTANLGITGDAAKAAGGEIANAAATMDVSLSDLAGTTSLDELVGKLGLVGPAADFFKETIVKDAKDTGTSFSLLNDAAQTQLNSISTKLGITGQDANTFKEKIAEMTGGNTAKLQELAKDKSLDEVITTLGLSGAAADKFRALFGGDMDKTGAAADGAKGKVNDFGTAINKLPDNKDVKIAEQGAAEAAQRVADLASQLRELKDRQITINVSAQVDSKFAQGLLGNAYGGIIAGGVQVAGGRAFAAGGIITSPTWFGNSLAGEAGAEAIVPLTQPISQVDPSVRALAAYAQALNNGTISSSAPGKVTTVASGAIQIFATDNAEQTAAAALDRLVAESR